MKKGVKIAVVSLLVVTLMMCFGCSNQTATPQKAATVDQDVNIRLSYGLPEKHFISYQIQDVVATAMKNNSSLKIKTYPGAQLYKDADALEAVQTGAIECAMSYDFNLSSIIPEWGFVACPGLLDTTDLTYKALTDPTIRPQLEKVMEAKGLKLICTLPWIAEEVGLTTTKPVHVPADSKGMTTRVSGPQGDALCKHWGFGTTFLSGSEVYMALQRGVIQASHAAVTTDIERKFYEIAPYHTILPLGNIVTTIIMNKTFFDKLSAAQQKALLDAGKTVESTTVAKAKANLQEVLAQAKSVETVYTPTADEMKLWNAGMDDVIKSVYKDPATLAIIKQIQLMKTAK